MIYPEIKKFLHKLKQLAKAEPVPCVGGRSDLPTQPGLKVKGRPISLPVNQEELRWLCKQGRASPFGKGMDTVLDTEIRCSIECEAYDIEITNPYWKPALEQLIDSIAVQMGIDFKIEAKLFKLLVYQEGGHFKFHQDTEKAQGMFATLIIQLPSRCQDGSLVCRFADKEYRFDFGKKEADAEFSIYYAAHYADVHHQVEKIEEGSRLVLIYNLIQPVKKRQLSASYHKQLLYSVQELVPPIFSLLSQEQHAFLLQHEYTEQSLSNLGFLAAKGQDRYLIKALLAINEHLPIEQKLYFIIGRLSYSTTSSTCGDYYDINWEVIESTEPGCELCFDEEGQIIPTDNFRIDWVHDLSKKEIVSIAFNKIDEDFWGEGNDDIEGYMGNYGPTKETTYARYVLAVMPVYPTNDHGLSQDAVLQAHNVALMAQNLHIYPNCDWLQERFDLALKNVLKQFSFILSKKETSYLSHSGFDKSSQAIFIKLLKTAIKRDDHELCQTLLNTAKESLVASLSSKSQVNNLLRLLKDVIEHFGWEGLSDPCIPLLRALSASAALHSAITLAENSTDINMCAELMNICVSAVCREKASWGGRCSFKKTILPLALNLCKTQWHAPNKSKAVFLETCLKKGEEQPSFLSVLIKKLISDTQANNKEWLLSILITARLKYLEDELMRKPKEFTWSMPNARAGKSAIDLFLQSDHQETIMTGYNGIAMARRDVVNVDPKWILPEFYMESNAVFLKPGDHYGFSADMQALGRGKTAYVQIKKNKKYDELCSKLRALRKRELKELKKMIQPEFSG